MHGISPHFLEKHRKGKIMSNHAATPSGEQEKVWEMIFELARSNNVQVFAATHSWDCIEAFKNVSQRVADSAVLFRIGRSMKTSERGKAIATPQLADGVDLACDWRTLTLRKGKVPPTWTLVEQLLASGHHGARVPSVRHKGGINIVLWSWNEKGAPKLQAFDPNKDLPLDPASWSKGTK